MNKRKLMLVAVALCMVAVLVTGGTLAYLTDSEYKENTFTLGNVTIDIEEYTYKDGVWAPFVDDTKLNPLENEQGFVIYNKIVHTFNTSSSMNDAYIRTVVLFEKNDLLTADYKNEGDCCFPGVHYGYNNVVGATKSSDGHYYYGVKEYEFGEVTYNGENYWYVVFVDADEKPIPYDAAQYSLASVWMDKNISSETIKGWGDTLDVIVCSQAIQAEGLTHAEAMTELGAITAENLAKWNVTVADVDNLNVKGVAGN